MANTGFTVNGVDVSVNTPFISKSYLLDRYPELANTFKTAGLWGWGRNSLGNLGASEGTNMSSPIQTLAGGTNWQQVSAAPNSFFQLAIKTDGTLWVWGNNDRGQLGTNDTTYYNSPRQTVASGNNWKQVSSGGRLSAAIKTDGTLWTWGRNSYGQLGTNDITDRSSPVQTISGGTNWKQVSVGYKYMMAIKTDGTLWGWGNNNYGQLGNNQGGSPYTWFKSSPVQTVSGGTNWKQVSAGGYITTAIKTDGTLWGWGNNDYGGLGNNTTTTAYSPIQTISGGTNWKLSRSSYHTVFGIKTDGTLWAWGQNNNGQLGDNTIVNKSSPVQTISGGTNWYSVECAKSTSTRHVVALKQDGTLWTWGDNSFGQLGDNTIVNKSSPVQTISGGTNWKQVSAGYMFTSAIRDDSADYGIGTL